MRRSDEELVTRELARFARAPGFILVEVEDVNGVVTYSFDSIVDALDRCRYRLC